MNNDKLPIDDLFKRALENYTQEEPSNHVWSIISKKLLLQNFAKLGIFKINAWTAVSGVAAAALVTAVILFSNQDEKTVSENKIAPQKNQSITQPFDSASEEKITAISLRTATPEIHEVSENNAIVNKGLNSTKKVEHSTLKQIVATEPTKASLPAAEKVKSFEVAQKATLANENAKQVVKQKIDAQEKSANIVEKLQPAIQKTEVVQEQKVVEKGEKSLVETIVIHPDVQKEQNAKMGNELRKSNSLSIDSTIRSPKEEGIFPKKKTTASVTYDYRHWAVDVFTSFNFNSKKSEWSVPVFQNYYNFQNKESNAISNDFGLELTYKTSPGLVFKTGINYSTYADKQDINFMYKGSDTLYYLFIDSNWIPNPIPGEPLILKVDTLLLYAIDSFPRYQSLNALNQYHYYEIPLLIGWSQKFKNLDIEILGGVSIGFLSGSNLWYYDPKKGFLQTEGKSFPIRKTILNLSLRMTAIYNFNNHMGFIFGPAYRRNLNSIFEDDYPLDQKFNSFSVQLGLRYRF